MEKFFKVAERGSNPAQEFRAGITTFLAMAYIIAVNPALLAVCRSSNFGSYYCYLSWWRHHDHFDGSVL